MSEHPAPGSPVPGAPPALRRPLTGEDGAAAAVPESAEASPGEPALPAPPEAAAAPSHAAILPAAGLLGLAIGLALERKVHR